MTEPHRMDNAIAIALLVRGADKHWREGVDRVAKAFSTFPPGKPAVFYALFKGFASPSDRREAYSRLQRHVDRTFDLADDTFDIGAYRSAARQIAERRVCFLNGYSEPLSPDWLAKLSTNHTPNEVGAVGSTASYETLRTSIRKFPPFPNPHLRSNAFLVETALFLEIADRFRFRSKEEAFQFESGGNGLTALLRRRGLRVLVAGRDGRGYEPTFWPLSATFRLGDQANLLIGDNQTRAYSEMSWAEKRDAVLRTWGRYADPLRYRLDVTLYEGCRDSLHLRPTVCRQP